MVERPVPGELREVQHMDRWSRDEIRAAAVMGLAALGLTFGNAIVNALLLALGL